jgi:hypothetical protein
MRHAEKPDDLMNPDLSDAGRERAKALVTWLPQVCPNFEFLFASAISMHSARPFETVKPLSKATGIPIDSTYADQDFAVLAHGLLSVQNYAGKTIIICWHHGHIPAFAADLGAPAGSYPDPWDPVVFNLVLRIDYDEHGHATVTVIGEPF